jgi:hypothetical protein
VDLLHHLMRDEDFAGQLAAEKAIKKYYVALCRTKGTKTFPWLSVARPLNRVLRLVYGPTYQKTYKRIYEGSRLRKRRVYRVPLLAEFTRRPKLWSKSRTSLRSRDQLRCRKRSASEPSARRWCR